MSRIFINSYEYGYKANIFPTTGLVSNSIAKKREGSPLLNGDFYSNSLISRNYGTLLKNQYMKPSSVTFGYNLFLKHIPGQECAYCNRKVFMGEEIAEFKTTTPDLHGKKLVKKLIEHTGQLNGSEQKVAKLIISMSQQYPDKPARAIIMDLVRLSEPILEEKQMRVYRRLEDVAYNNLPPEKFYLIENILQPAEKKELFKRKEIISNLLKLDQIFTTDREKAVFDVLKRISISLPASKSCPEAFIVKYGKRTPEEFMEHLVDPLRVTADHIFLHKNDGSNNKSNLLNACGECNWTRGDMEFDEWIQENPERIKNVINYVNNVNRLVNDPRLVRLFDEDIKNYPLEICQTIKNATDGRLDIQVASFN